MDEKQLLSLLSAYVVEEDGEVVAEGETGTKEPEAAAAGQEQVGPTTAPASLRSLAVRPCAQNYVCKSQSCMVTASLRSLAVRCVKTAPRERPCIKGVADSLAETSLLPLSVPVPV